jgi:signal transduction histidine kinase
MATNSGTHSRRAGRSLYWRIVLSFCVCIAAVLGVQTTVAVLWMQRAPEPPRLSAFTHAVADDLASALARDRALDVQQYVNRHYPKPFASLYIVMAATEQVIFAGPLRPPQFSVTGALDFYRQHPTKLPDSWISGPYQVSPIVVDGQLAGGVGAVVPVTWKELLGWRMAALSAALFLAGTGLAGLFIFGPVRRRLQNLDQTAQRFGAGDFDARADENGADELASLAATFNRMAIDLAARDEQLRAADRTRRLLLADISHELMTPLTAIRAYREVLSASELARDPETAHSLEVIADETSRLDSLIGDLLDLARLEAGGDSLEPRDVSVENLFGRIAARHELDARKRHVTIETRVDAGAEVLYGDPLRLEQALENLVANALRHAPAETEVEIWAEVRTGEVLLSVRDAGRGIPAEHLPFVFDRFYKVDPARSEEEPTGSGLGLSIVKAIVERHGGAVSVLSDPGVATVFTIHLPISPPIALEFPRRTTPERDTTHDDSAHSPRRDEDGAGRGRAPRDSGMGAAGARPRRDARPVHRHS